MTAWRRFQTLSAADRGLLAEAAAWLIVVRLGLVLFRYTTLRRVLARCAAQRNASGRVEKIVWAVSVASVRLPFSSSCLVHALAAHVMLGRRGHSPELRFGVRFGGAGSARLVAHAWIDLCGVAVIGRPNDIDGFLEMSPPGVA